MHNELVNGVPYFRVTALVEEFVLAGRGVASVDQFVVVLLVVNGLRTTANRVPLSRQRRFRVAPFVGTAVRVRVPTNCL